MKEKKKQLVPIGVRFNLVQFEFVKAKENLGTHQSVVNFLLKDYFDRANQPAPEPVVTQLETWEVPNEEIWRVIAELFMKKCPPDRCKTLMGFSSWYKDQLKEAEEFKKQLK